MKNIATTLLVTAGLFLGSCGEKDSEKSKSTILPKEIIGTIIDRGTTKTYENLDENLKLTKEDKTYLIMTEKNDTFGVSPIFTSEYIFNIGDKVKLQTEEEKIKVIYLKHNYSFPSLKIVSYEILEKTK